MDYPLSSRDGGADRRDEQIRIVLNNDLSEIERLGLELERFGQRCGLSAKTLLELNLILEEVVVNVISYAYRDDRRHEIVVDAVSKDGELTIEVKDDGRPFNPLLIPPPDLERSLEETQIGGLGLHLVHELSSSLEYERREERNCLLIKKKTERREQPGR
jgi:anti-sigma regulatory factor (Ser/Thr protein kinase)